MLILKSGEAQIIALKVNISQIQREHCPHQITKTSWIFRRMTKKIRDFCASVNRKLLSKDALVEAVKGIEGP